MTIINTVGQIPRPVDIMFLFADKCVPTGLVHIHNKVVFPLAS